MHTYILSAFCCLLSFSFLACKGKNEPNGTVVTTDSSLTLILQKSIAVPEPSGLAYNNKTKTLYTVSDKNSTIYEMSVNGDITRSFGVSCLDMEGITFSKNYDTLSVVDESSFEVVSYSLTGNKLSSFQIVTSDNTKHGYEGITRTPSDNFIIINEKEPMLIVEADPAGRELRRRTIAYTTDISDICYDSALACYWMVSDESKKLLKLSLDFSLLNSWSIDINQAEGVAASEDRLYVVSDSDAKLYVFTKPK